jgi:formylglycine-generating enzyme
VTDTDATDGARPDGFDDDAAPPEGPPAAGMVWVPGGTFRMGSDDQYPEEAPAHLVTVRGFWMDRCAVTNDEFALFVRETGHVTLAEQVPEAADYPGARPEMLVAASSVFRKPGRRVSLDDPYAWWTWVPGADWRHPRGPQSSIRRLGDHPVVHVAWADVEAYAAWAGKDLPTEAEWERAARGGLDGAEFAWGDELTPGGRHMANVWQGDFPNHNTKADGWEYTAPAKSYPPNGFGLFQMTGNVWEWTIDLFTADHAAHRSCCVPGAEGDHIPRRIIKGGSHLCAPNYCLRYRPAARQGEAVDTSTGHIGFRCVVRE